MKLEGRSVLITGASSGIGRATALLLAQKGVHLTLVGRRPEPLAAVAREIASLQPHAATQSPVVIAGDVADPSTGNNALKAAVEAFGGLDAHINNAGNVRAGRLDDTPEADIRRMIDVDLLAPILLTRAALPVLRRSGDATVVLVSSGLALVGAPYYATYAAAKAGLARFGEALRRELLDEGVHVMTIYPGATDTPMMATNRAGPELGFTRETPEAVAEALVSGLETGALEVIRGGEARATMIATNRDQPERLDDRLRGLKSQLLGAVADHSAL